MPRSVPKALMHKACEERGESADSCHLNALGKALLLGQGVAVKRGVPEDALQAFVHVLISVRT